MTCLGQKARLLRRRYYDLAMTRQGVTASRAKQSQRLLRMVRSLYEQKTLQGTGALVSATEKVYNVDVAVLM